MTYIQKVIQGLFQGKLTRREAAFFLMRGLSIEQIPELLEQTPQDVVDMIMGATMAPSEAFVEWGPIDSMSPEQIKKEKIEYLSGLDSFRMYMSQK